MQGIIRTIRDGSGFDILLLGLALAYLIAFSAFPILYNIIMSLQTVDMFTITSFNRPFVGLQNYYDVISQPIAMAVLWNTVKFVV
ncbi:sugar ABC transporter permease, partial [Mycobacterium tuberculosis]|nr:sugar ABC transporter permease [Mycobacterium tuberculosis]